MPALLRAWVDDDLPRALKLCDQATDECPRDLVMVKVHQYFEFNRGNSPEMLRVALKVNEAAAEVPYVHGMAAFAYEQCHLLDEAEHAAPSGASHAAQGTLGAARAGACMLTRGHIDEGAAFLRVASRHLDGASIRSWSRTCGGISRCIT